MSESSKKFAQRLFNKDTLDEDDGVFCVELDDYARRIGIDPQCEPELLHIAAEGMFSDLPVGWHYHRNLHGEVLYYNDRTYTATRENPVEKLYHQRVLQERVRVHTQKDALVSEITPKEDVPTSVGRPAQNGLTLPPSSTSVSMEEDTKMKEERMKTEEKRDSVMSEPSKRFAQRLFSKDTLDEEDMIFCVELDDYARRIGIDPECEPELLQIAAEGMFSDLPVGWQYHRNLEGDIFYYNDRTYTVTHENPIERRCKQRVLQEREKIQTQNDANFSDSTSSTSASATEDKNKDTTGSEGGDAESHGSDDEKDEEKEEDGSQGESPAEREKKDVKLRQTRFKLEADHETWEVERRRDLKPKREEICTPDTLYLQQKQSLAFELLQKDQASLCSTLKRVRQERDKARNALKRVSEKMVQMREEMEKLGSEKSLLQDKYYQLSQRVSLQPYISSQQKEGKYYMENAKRDSQLDSSPAKQGSCDVYLVKEGDASVKITKMDNQKGKACLDLLKVLDLTDSLLALSGNLNALLVALNVAVKPRQSEGDHADHPKESYMHPSRDLTHFTPHPLYYVH